MRLCFIQLGGGEAYGDAQLRSVSFEHKSGYITNLLDPLLTRETATAFVSSWIRKPIFKIASTSIETTTDSSEPENCLKDF